MKGLSNEISLALDTVIEGLQLPFDIDEDNIDDDKIKQVVNSKVSSINTAKHLLKRWIESDNRPTKKTITEYTTSLINAGRQSIDSLRKALAKRIDYEKIDYTRHDITIKAKQHILESIFLINENILDLENRLQDGELVFDDTEFKIGYPERIAAGEIIDRTKDITKFYSETENIIYLCKKGTKGEIIELYDGLKVQLPEVPQKKREILFYKKPKSEQYWQRLPMPNITPENIHEHEKFIIKEFERRIYGVWFMNNGKPTYLTGNHYFALQYCKMRDDGGYMDFREAQQLYMYHVEACMLDDRCLGQVFVKSRRTGATYLLLATMLNQATMTKNGLFGMTSKTDEDAKYAFEKLSYMFLNLPFFFRPVVKGKEDSVKFLEFGKPSDNSKAGKKKHDKNIDYYLNTKIDYQATKNDAYDGQKLNMYIGDEAGKWKPPNDYIKHLGQITPTMMPNGRVVGKMFLCSTVGQMKLGGKQYKEIVQNSKFSERDVVTKKTTTGLYAYFMPAQNNMPDFTDKYGKCYTEAPTEYVENIFNKPITIGSITYLISEEEKKRKQSDEALNEQYRAYPRTLEYAFRDESVSSSFNINKIYEQIDYLSNNPPKYSIGNFEWKDVKDGDVVFVPNKNGRCRVAWLPKNDDMLTNNVIEQNGWYYPVNYEIGAFGIDPYSLKDTRGRGSLGSIHGKTMDVVANENIPNNKFFLEYIARPSDETIFYEDVIKILRFYSMPALIERNVIGLVKYMYERGYRPFVLNRIDKEKNELTKDELKYGGQTMSNESIQEAHINAINTWINHNIGRKYDEENSKEYYTDNMPFIDTLYDWATFTHENRTKHDATISSGLAIMACNRNKYKGLKKSVTLRRPIFKKYYYKGIETIIQ